MACGSERLGSTNFEVITKKKMIILNYSRSLTVLKRLNVIPRALASLIGRRDPRTAERGVAAPHGCCLRHWDNGGRLATVEDVLHNSTSLSAGRAPCMGDCKVDILTRRGELGRRAAALARSLGLQRRFGELDVADNSKPQQLMKKITTNNNHLTRQSLKHQQYIWDWDQRWNTLQVV